MSQGLNYPLMRQSLGRVWAAAQCCTLKTIPPFIPRPTYWQLQEASPPAGPTVFGPIKLPISVPSFPEFGRRSPNLSASFLELTEQRDLEDCLVSGQLAIFLWWQWILGAALRGFALPLEAMALGAPKPRERWIASADRCRPGPFAKDGFSPSADWQRTCESEARHPPDQYLKVLRPPAELSLGVPKRPPMNGMRKPPSRCPNP